MKKLLFSLCLIAMAFGTLQAAVIEVTNADTNSVADAIDLALPGDVIELVSDGVYLSTSQIALDQDITIRAAATLANKPVYKYIGTSTGAYLFKGLGSAHITISGIEFDGDGVADGAGGMAKYFVIIRNDDPLLTLDLFVDNVDAHDFADKIIKPYGNAGIDSLVVTNSVFSGGASEGITLYSGSTSDPAAVFAYAEISNCTFYAIEREAIKGDTYVGGVVRVDRCTIYDCGNVENKPMIYFRDMTDVIVKNSIFANSQNADSGEEFADFDSDVSLFNNNIMWDIVNWDVGTATATDTLTADPMFADAVNADFTVGNPIVLTFADDGGSVGDSRWIPAVEVTEVTNDAHNSLSDAIAASAAGDILELVSNGVYTIDVEMALEHDITIRGSAALPSMPVVQYVGTSSTHMFRGYGSSHISISNIEFNGNRPDGGLAKYFVRIDNGDPTATLDLFVDNVIAHDYADKIIKAYGGTGIDSVVITNSVFYNGASEGICLYEGSSSAAPTVINYAEVSNCTLYDIEREAIKAELYAGSEIVIDRCTIYACGNVENKPMLRFRDVTDLVVKNSIFANSQNADSGEEFADLGDPVVPTILFNNNAVWDVVNTDVGGGTVSDTVHVDPMFADAANYDFTLPEDSPLYSFADDGGSIGDMRWAPPLGVYFLSTFVVGGGEIALNPAGGEYEEGTSVTLTATPDEYYAFDHWDPAIVFPPDNPVATITMNESRSVTAHFVPTITEYDVSLATIGFGHIEETIRHQYPLDEYIEGDTVDLTAVADSANWEFAYWVNAEQDSIAAGDIYYIVASDTTFTAMFRSTLDQFSLTTVVAGLGSVTVSPMPVSGFTTYDVGTVVSIEANAPLGIEFSGYSGDVTSTDNPLSVTLDANKSITATFTEINHTDGILAIGSDWDLLDALEYSGNNSQVSRILLTDVGPFVPTEELRSEGKMPQLNITQTIEILGADTLSAKPLIMGYTSSTGGSSSEGFFRMRMGGNLTLKNVAIDGWMDGALVPAKYLFRADDSDNFGFHTSVKAFGVDFKSTIEVFYKNYPSAFVDSMIFDQCVIEDIGKEAIFMNTVGDAAYISITNSTFKRVGREVLYMKNMNPVTILDHLTIDTCGHGYGTEGAKFGAVRIENTTNVTFTNSIINNVPNTAYGYGLRVAGENSYVDNLLLNNVAEDLQLRDDATLGADVFWYDPMFADVAAEDYTLQDSSFAYHLQSDDSPAIGDPRWATSSAIASYHALNLDLVGEGLVMLSPEPMTKFYLPSTVVTASAAPDSLGQFDGWTGDVVSSDAAVSLTMDADKYLTANFSVPMYTLNLNVNMQYQVFIETFNPATDSLDVAGTFNDWGAEATWLEDADGDTVWSVSMEFPALAPDLNFEYKFRINASWDDATSEFPFGAPGRMLNLVSDTTITVWYDNKDLTTSIDDHLLPEAYSLAQNYPNPFNPSTSISFALLENADTKLTLYDMRGREIEQLVNQNMTPGRYTVTFNGSAYASGVYFYRLTSGSFSDVKKLMLIK